VARVTFLGLDPEGVQTLADRLADIAQTTGDLAGDARRALVTSELESRTPTALHELAASLAQTSAVLQTRGRFASGFVIDLALHQALLDVAHALAIDNPPSCILGPSTTVGAASPCDPVETVKVYSLGAGAFIPLAGVLGLKLDGTYVLRVEYLHSGRLRVTRIDEAAIGVAWSVGQDAEVSAGPLTTMSGVSAKAWVQLLLAQGTTYEIARGDLDEFLVNDALDHLERQLSLPGAFPGLGLLTGAAKKATGFASGLPLWKANGPIDALRRRLGWKPPKPRSTFVEAGVTAGSNASLGVPLLGKIPVRGKTGISVSGRAVVGVERRNGGGAQRERHLETAFYLDLRAEIGTPLAVRMFGIDLSKLRSLETKFGLVRNETSGGFEHIEITIVSDDGRTIERRTAVIDLTDPVTHPAAQRLVDRITDPAGLPDAYDALEKLLGHQVTVEHTTMRRVTRTTHGVEAMGNGLRFTVDELDVR
jgi:hypothetical protein